MSVTSVTKHRGRGLKQGIKLNQASYVFGKHFAYDLFGNQWCWIFSVKAVKHFWQTCHNVESRSSINFFLTGFYLCYQSGCRKKGLHKQKHFSVQARGNKDICFLSINCPFPVSFIFCDFFFSTAMFLAVLETGWNHSRLVSYYAL